MTEHEEFVSGIARATDVPEEQVRSVLEHLGLQAALDEVRQAGGHEKISAGDAKLAFRLGRNTIAV